MDGQARVRVDPGNAQIQGRRVEQQDAFGFGRFDDAVFLAHGGYLVVLADGMGGLLDGREAAWRAVLGFIENYSAKAPKEPIPAALDRALAAANREVHALASGGAGEGECGTTLVAAVVQADRLHWVSVGDSRLYHFDRTTGALRQLNADHRYARELERAVAAGYLAAEEAETHPDREALTSFLGLTEIPELDHSAQALDLGPGDRVLLCSDGVYRALDTAALAAALALPAQAAAERLVAGVSAADDPHQDNATVAVLALEADGVPAPAEGPAPPRRRVRPWLWLLLAFLALFAAFYHGGLGERWPPPLQPAAPPTPADAPLDGTADPLPSPH